jgi:hypothetical protein
MSFTVFRIKEGGPRAKASGNHIPHADKTSADKRKAEANDPIRHGNFYPPAFYLGRHFEA